MTIEVVYDLHHVTSHTSNRHTESAGYLWIGETIDGREEEHLTGSVTQHLQHGEPVIHLRFEDGRAVDRIEVQARDKRTSSRWISVATYLDLSLKGFLSSPALSSVTSTARCHDVTVAIAAAVADRHAMLDRGAIRVPRADIPSHRFLAIEAPPALGYHHAIHRSPSR